MPVIEVRPSNVRTVAVYRRCRPVRLPIQSKGGTRFHYDGIEANEIESVCRLLRVPRAELTRVLDGVRYMASIAHEKLNK